jgi:hypothetical protein
MMCAESMTTEELCGRLRQAGDSMLAEAANRIEYYAGQEALLEQAQQANARLRAEAEEVARPLDAEMGRLNRNLITANAQLEAMRHLLVWTLWHHQGGSSPVGQPIRAALGIDRFARIPSEDLRLAKAYLMTWSSQAGIHIDVQA